MNKNIKIIKPIFIIGTGRCGSTIFYRMLVNHPDIAFISNLNIKYPKLLFIYRVNTLFGKLGLRMGKIHPSEAYSLFNSIIAGYGRPIRTLKSSEVSMSVYKGVRHLVYHLFNTSSI